MMTAQYFVKMTTIRTLFFSKRTLMKFGAMMKEGIAITGSPARFAQADDLGVFKKNLYAGVDFVTSDGTRWPRGSTDKSQALRLKIVRNLFPERVLIEMNGRDGATPLFMVHSIHGHVNDLSEVAVHLPVRAVGVQRTTDIPVHSIQEMAAIYLQKLTQVQPTGPYHLAGYSFGATLAFEMAVQLQNSGASVDSLTLLDGSPLYVAARWQEFQSRYEGRQSDFESFLIRAFLMQQADVDVSEFRSHLKQCPDWDAKKQAATAILLKAIPDLRTRPQDVDTAVQVFRDLFMVGSKYRPHLNFCGDVMLVKSSKPETMPKKLPPDYGLSEFVHGRVEVKVVDGFHEDFVSGQGAQQCAAIIARHVLQRRVEDCGGKHREGDAQTNNCSD